MAAHESQACIILSQPARRYPCGGVYGGRIGVTLVAVVLPRQIGYTGAARKEVHVSRFHLIAALVAVTLLAGCATTLKGARVPEGFRITRIAASDPAAPFAVSPSGAVAFVSAGRIEIRDRSGNVIAIPDAPAGALCFSPAGDRLAAGFPSAGETTLRLYDAAGKPVAETRVPGRITSLIWRSERELLAGALTVKKYSFGSDLKSWLYRWDGGTAPVATLLTGVTLRPKVAAMPEALLYNQLLIAVSPYGDEIAYSALKDPPVFTPYLKVSTRNLETGGETEVAKTTLGAGRVAYTPDGEALLVGDDKETGRVSLRDGKTVARWPSSGRSLAVSPSGAHTFLDAQLYQGDRVSATFPAGTRGVFLPDGSGLALSHQGTLYLVSGLKDAPAPPLPFDLDRLLELRRLKSQGLITESEYRREKDKGATP